MNVEELGYLANWLKKHATIAEQKYQAVQAILQHNAQQPQKKPLENPLNDLLDFLQRVPIHVLSNEQVKLLDAFEVSTLLGLAQK